MPGITHTISNQGLDAASWQAACEDMLEHLKSVTPVRTGFLQSEWRMRVSPQSVTFTDDVPYASFVNDGTPNMAPRDMTGELDGVADDIMEQHRKPDEEIDQEDYRNARSAQLPPYRR